MNTGIFYGTQKLHNLFCRETVICFDSVLASCRRRLTVFFYILLLGTLSYILNYTPELRFPPSSWHLLFCQFLSLILLKFRLFCLLLS